MKDNTADLGGKEELSDYMAGIERDEQLHAWYYNNVVPFRRKSQRIGVTFFPNEYAKSMNVESMTLEELCELIQNTRKKSKGALPWLKLAQFSGEYSAGDCLRFDDAVVAISGIELDYDEKQMTLDAAIVIATKAKLQSLLYTSANYADKAPKWRIVLPTSKPLPPEERVKLVARVHGLYGGIFDPASFVLSQAYYFGSVNNPNHRAVVVKGDFIDRRNDLDPGALDKNGAASREEPKQSSEEKNWAQRLGEEQSYPKPPPEKVIAALAIVVNDVDYNTWIEVGQEIKSWDTSDEVGWQIWDEWGATWSGKPENGKLATYDRAFARKRWKSFRPTRTNIGALFNRATAISPGWWDRAQAEAEASEAGGSIKTKLMQTSAEFVAGFVPPDYLIDGLLQRRYVYSFTGPTGSGKTAITLLIAAHVARGEPLTGREVERGRVLFFAGENPDDVRTRWIRLCEELKTDPDTMDVVFMPFTPNISENKIRAQINAEADEHGPFSLLIVDTSAAYYTGDDENDNVALGKHARMLRTFVNLPGGPTVLVTCHPTKTPNMDNLLPRGGGAFLAEVDGNLVCIKDPSTMTVEVTTHGKFRGPDFPPFSFNLVAGESERLVDSKGRSIWSIFARPISNEEIERIKRVGHLDQDEVLRAMLDQPGKSLLAYAEQLHWLTMQGEPSKQKVHRVMLKLKQAKLVEVTRDDRYILTKKGGEEAEKTPPSMIVVTEKTRPEQEKPRPRQPPKRTDSC